MNVEKLKLDNDLSINNGSAYIDMPDKLLGEKYEVSTRFGKKAVNYKGNISVLDKIVIPSEVSAKTNTGEKINGKKVETTEQSAMVSKVEPPVNVISDTEALNIDKAIKSSKKEIPEKIVHFSTPEKYDGVISFEEVYNYTNPDGTKLNSFPAFHLEAFIWYQEQLGRKLSDNWYRLAKYPNFDTGLVRRMVTEGALFYDHGELVPKYIYLSGDVYAKKAKLEGSDKEKIILEYGQDVYDRQKELLEDVFQEMYQSRLTIIPKAYNDNGQPLNKLIIKPISSFVKTFTVETLVDEEEFWVVESKKSGSYGEPNFDSVNNDKSIYRRDHFKELSLLNAFIYWLRFYEQEYKFRRSGINWATIRDFYLEKKQFYRKRDITEADYKRKCAIAQSEGERLFDEFLQKWILEKDRVKIETKWNDKYFGYKDIDYDLIPFAFSCAKYELDGSPIEFRFEKRDAVSFSFSEGTGLLAYQVGLGKTRSAIFSIAQNVDAGYCKRPFIVVPNQTYKQWISEINHLLPHYKINDLYNLSPEYIEKIKSEGRWLLKSDGTEINKNLLWQNAQGEQMYGQTKLESDLLSDVAVYSEVSEVEPLSITMLTFEGLKRLGFNGWTKSLLEYDLMAILEQEDNELSAKALEARKGKISDDIGAALEGSVVNIEDLGLDYMVLDESHAAKKVFTRVKGESLGDGERGKNRYEISSGKRSTMAVKTFAISQYIQRENNNSNVLLLTATPFTNSPLEVFSMLALISYQKLKYSELSSLQNFFNNFVQVENELVIDSKLKPARKDVFKGFNNLPALQTLIARFMLYKEGDMPDNKGRVVKLTRPNKYVLPLKYDPISEVKALLPLDQQIKTNLSFNPIQEACMKLVQAYVEENISLERLKAETSIILNQIDTAKGRIVAEEKKEIKAYTEKELNAKSVSNLVDIAVADVGIKKSNLKGVPKKELIEIIMDSYLDDELDDTDSVELDENELPDIEKKGVRVLRGVNYARSLALSPHLFFESLLEGNFIKINPSDYIQMSAKLMYTMMCLKSVRQYHIDRNQPISGQIIYADRGKDHFHLIKKYIVDKIGYKEHEVVIIKSGSNKEDLKNLFLGQRFNDETGKYENIPDEQRAKIVIGSSSIKEGINLQRYTSVLYDLFLPWNPTDIVQLDGRAWRQGNYFKDMRIVRPLMENSMDIFMFQKLEEKASRINQIWNRDGNTSIIRLEEFDPVELKKELISDPKVIALLDIETEEEKLSEDIQELGNKIKLAEKVNDLLFKLSEDNSRYYNILKVVERYRGKKEYTPDSLFRNYKNIIATQKDSEGNKISSSYFDYHHNVGPSGIREFSSFKDLVKLNNSLKKYVKEFLVPNKIDATKDALENFVEKTKADKEKLTDYLKSLRDNDKIQKRIDVIKADKKKNKIKTASVEDRVKEFEKLNHLLDNRKVLKIDCKKCDKKKEKKEIIVKKQPVKSNYEQIEEAIETFKMLLEIEDDKQKQEDIKEAIEAFEILLSFQSIVPSKELKEGIVLVHPRFGEGTVLSFDDKKVDLKFGDTEKTILIKFSGLKYKDGTLVYADDSPEEKKEKPKKVIPVVRKKMSRVEKKRAKDKKAIEAFNKLSNLQKIKQKILWINGITKGDRNSVSYKLVSEMLHQIEYLADKEKNQRIVDIINSVDKYMSASEKQAYAIAKFADDSNYEFNE
jgi:hypothetical protein